MRYTVRIGGTLRSFHLRSLVTIPREIIAQATRETAMWRLLEWGLDSPAAVADLEHAPIREIKKLYKAWQKDSQISAEEIAQLLNLIDDEPDALEADLVYKGMRLRDFPSDRHNWRDLYVFVTYADAHSRIVAATQPNRAGWDHLAMLLAEATDALNWLQWAKTKAAAEGGEPPDRIVRPGVKPREYRKGSKVKPMLLSRVKELAFGNTRATTEERSRKLSHLFK